MGLARPPRGARRSSAPRPRAWLGLVAVLALVLVTSPSAYAAWSRDDPGAPPEASRPQTVAGLVEALRRTPVVVDRTMGQGDAAGARRLLESEARRVPFPVFVALVSRPRDAVAGATDPTALITDLHRRLGRPGLYVAGVVGGTVSSAAFGVPADPTLVELSAYTAAHQLEGRIGHDVIEAPVLDAAVTVLTAQHAAQLPDLVRPGRYPAAVPAADLRALARTEFARPAAHDAPEPVAGRGQAPAEVEDRWFAGGAAFGFVLPLALVLLRGRRPGTPRRRARPAPAPTSRGGRPRYRSLVVPPPTTVRPAQVVVAARSELQQLVTALGQADVRPDRAHLWDRADRAREAAEDLVGSRHRADQVGALVLVRTGQRDLDRARRWSSVPYHCCFLDPLHGEASATISLVQGESRVSVPVCDSCRRVEDGMEPLPLRIGRTPYYERGDVWARTGYGALVDDLAEVVLRERAR